ncbi:TetR/AcrR family transcriptional regulator [Klenkia sp. PcliD-1-E]|uniref:TetR/AcrR family transcriptional regulator n=1 Tax=Klenkia sp. PcliD-1-E TaxID=2954492 RepID=UPI002096FDE6|nr:TetR/AcrR family transcriptional regulator [Klenkia sp. PcliD-1-E]MCO7222022.1 TetR/AcrR family transcriptional regulator [Klenkia sp. PcliD-1-E]
MTALLDTLPASPARPAGSATRGRPRDAQLTRRLVDAALDVVVDRGLAALTVDELIARTGAGRSAVYRRWRSVEDLVWRVALSCEPVPPFPPTGTLDGDLRALLAPLTQPLDRAGRFLGAVWGAAQHDEVLRAAIRARLVDPLCAAVDDVLRAHADRSGDVGPATADQLARVVLGLWLQRLLLDRPSVEASEVDSLVGDVLVPLVDRAEGEGFEPSRSVNP